MIHIALISPCMGRYGGLEGFVLTLAAGISQIPGFAVEVLFKRAGTFELHPELEEQIRESGTSVRFCDKASGLLCQVIRHADLVHLQNLSPDMILAARLLGKPLLATIHARSTGRAGLHQKIWHFVQRIVPQRFYVSEFVRKSWEGPNRRPGSHVVHSICKLPDAPAPWEGRRGFGFFSRFIPNKGLEELLPAYAACGLDPEIWPLHLVGAGPMEEWARQFVDRPQMTGVHLHGFVSDGEKHRLMGGCKFAVVPPNTQEDFGLVPLEARSLRVPCLITRDGGVPEAAGRHSLSCEPGDVRGLALLLRTAATMREEDYRRLATAAHETLEAELVRPEFYAGVYREIVARKRQRGRGEKPRAKLQG